LSIAFRKPAYAFIKCLERCRIPYTTIPVITILVAGWFKISLEFTIGFISA